MWKEFAQIHPHTVFFTAHWPGFTEGFAGTFNLKIIPGYRRLRLPFRGSSRRTGLMWASPRVIIDLLRFRPDIILTNGFHMWTLCALIVKAILRSKVILLWQGVSRETGGEHGSLRLRFRRSVGRLFDLAITNTSRGAEYLKTQVGCLPEKVQTFVGEVATRESFRKHALPLSQNSPAKPSFLYAGRLIPEKGVACLLHACALVAEEKGNQFSVTIAGAGPLEEELRTLAHKLRIEGLVQFEGFVPYEDAGMYYEASSVFVLPSFEDTWGVAAVEAMAFGKPVLCSRRAGVSELISVGANGFLFDPECPEELAQLMSNLIEQPELVTNLGKNAARLMESHTPAATAKGLSQLICATLSTSCEDAREGFPVSQRLIPHAKKAVTNVKYSLNTDSRPVRR